MRTNHDIKRGVSLYSYQNHYYFKKMSLEDCIAAVADLDAEGFEIMPEMMIPEFPHISDDFAAKWHGWMQQYDVTPIALTHFADRLMWKNRQMTDDELYERSVLYIKAANKLGCKVIRLMHSYHGGKPNASSMYISPCDLINPKIVERLLPVCEEYDVTMALECHAPTSIDDPCHQEYLEVAEKTGIKRVGLMADMSSFQIKDSKASRDFHVRKGGNPDIIDYLREVGSRKHRGEEIDLDEVRAYLKEHNANEIDWAYFNSRVEFAMVATTNETLKKYASQLVYIHAKFLWAEEDGTIEEIDYPGAIKALQEGGYKGFINSEFEGNRWMSDLGLTPEIEMVRRQHVLFKNLLGY